ncbi:MAG: M24 family metallopeptidase [Candidatus Geothermarchaeales archaeon]
MNFLHHDRRVRKIRESMEKRGLNALVLTSKKSLHYLCGFYISTASLTTSVVLPLDGEPTLVYYAADVDRMLHDWAWGSQIKKVKTWSLPLGDRYPEIRYEDMVIEALREQGVRGNSTIGVEFDFLSLHEYELLKRLLPETVFKDATPLMDDVMMVKDDEELAYLRRSTEIAEAGIEAAFDFVKSGVTELDVAAKAEYAMYKAGMDSPWIETQVGSGLRNSFFETPASDKIIQRGDTLRVDVHPMYRRYCMDLSRNIVLGRLSDELRRIADIVIEAAYTALDAIQVGVKVSEAFRRYHDVVEKSGIMDRPATPLGHGIGTINFRDPWMHEKNHRELKENEVICIAPNLLKPGLGGLVVEFPVLVKKPKTEALGTFPIEPIELGK